MIACDCHCCNLLLLLLPETVQEIENCAQEYHQYYVPELKARAQQKAELEQKRRERELSKLRKDMAQASLGSSSSGAVAPRQHAAEQHEADEDEGKSVDLNLSDDSIEGSVGLGSDDDR